jgi:hypothetical protein
VARLFWLIVVLGFVGLLFTGASWAAAFSTVGTYLGAPPPKMGSQTTSIEWPNMGELKDHPTAPLWRFAYGPTVIPGAANVRIYVNPIGRIVATEPSDLDARLEAFRKPMY